jgi:hypothetical protein
MANGAGSFNKGNGFLWYPNQNQLKNPYHIDRDSNKSLFKVKREVFSISDP